MRTNTALIQLGEELNRRDAFRLIRGHSRPILPDPLTHGEIRAVRGAWATGRFSAAELAAQYYVTIQTINAVTKE